MGLESGYHKVDTITMVPYGSLDTSEGQQTFLLLSDLWPETNISTWVKERKEKDPPPLISLSVIIQSYLIVFALVCGLGEREITSPNYFVKANCLFFFDKQSYRDRRHPLGHRKITMSN